MGRPTRLTREIAKAIEDRVRIGLPLTVAAEQVSIGGGLACEWVQRGEGTHCDPSKKKRRIYADFAERIKKAVADDQARRIGRIEQAARGGQVVARRTVTKPNGEVITEEKWSEPQWTADMTHLERRYPDQWGRRIVEHTGPQGGPMEFTFLIQRAVPSNGHGELDVTPQLAITAGGNGGNGHGGNGDG